MNETNNNNNEQNNFSNGMQSNAGNSWQNSSDQNNIRGQEINLQKNQENMRQEIPLNKDQYTQNNQSYTSNRSGFGSGQGQVQTQYNSYNQNNQNSSNVGGQGQRQPQYNNYQQNYNNANKKSSAPVIIIIIIIAILLLCCLPVGVISYLAIKDVKEQGGNYVSELKDALESYEYDDDSNSTSTNLKNVSDSVKDTMNSINNSLNSITNTVNEVNNAANSIKENVKNTDTTKTNTTSTDSKNTTSTNTTSTTTNNTSNTTKSVAAEAKESTKENPINVGTWGIASKYNSDTSNREKVYVKATKTIRGEDAKNVVKEFTDKSSFYKYTEPNEGLEWVVVDYDMDFSDFKIPKNGVEPRLSVSIAGTGSNSAVKYKGVTYFMIMTTNIGSSSYVKTTNAQGRIAFQMPIGCSDYIMKFGDSSGDIAFIKGE